MNTRIIASLDDIDAAQWDALAGDNPFLAHAFLAALHDTGCAVPATGWQPRFLTLWQDGRLAGALPLYLKSHSWGEFVFDWAWAEAYQRHGLAYYPKLVSGVPFTPVSGPRLLARDAATRTALIDAALALACDSGVSSLHVLFAPDDEAQAMAERGLLLRRGVQLHWHNPGYRCFDDYLADMRRDKRKKVQQERRKVMDAGIRFLHLTGTDIGPEHWQLFMRCYTRTHQQFGSPLALNLAFFQRIGAALAANVLLIVALRGDTPIAAAWFMRNAHTLYGRSWGTLEFHAGLHFETCYYQAIDYCIAEGLQRFEGGAQGEHKLARGFLPVTTWSAHWLAHPGFAHAVDDYLRREADGIGHYVDELNERAPFRKAPPG